MVNVRPRRIHGVETPQFCAGLLRFDDNPTNNNAVLLKDTVCVCLGGEGCQHTDNGGTKGTSSSLGVLGVCRRTFRSMGSVSLLVL